MLCYLLFWLLILSKSLFLWFFVGKLIKISKITKLIICWRLFRLRTSKRSKLRKWIIFCVLILWCFFLFFHFILVTFFPLQQVAKGSIVYPEIEWIHRILFLCNSKTMSIYGMAKVKVDVENTKPSHKNYFCSEYIYEELRVTTFLPESAEEINCKLYCSSPILNFQTNFLLVLDRTKCILTNPLPTVNGLRWNRYHLLWHIF